jgi:dTDP-4-amino-4,6-dideoxygalactose transaminase
MHFPAPSPIGTPPLAVLGGIPRFDSPKHVGTPAIPDRATLHARLDQMLDASSLTNDGPFVRELEALSRDRGVPLLFDAAHALGCTYAGRPMGAYGTASIVSFHATTFIQSLEGDASFTPDPDLAARLRLLRTFGFAGYDNVVSLGTNAKLDEFSAAMGLGSLEGLEDLVETNRGNRMAYRQVVAGLPGLSLYEFDDDERNNFQYLIVEVSPETCSLTRDELVWVLHAENVIARQCADRWQAITTCSTRPEARGLSLCSLTPAGLSHR